MAIRTGKVIMAKNIKLEKDYANVLSYSEADMVSLVMANAVQTFVSCSFLRPGENAIKLEMTYDNALKCNYMAFQNPDYSNKWFFAFVDEVEYVSNGSVIVRYTIDEFSTWWDYWYPEQCFVEREHAMTDTPGDNLIPEGLELGEYIQNGSLQHVSYESDDLLIAMNAQYEPDGTSWESVKVCGIPCPGCLTFHENIMDWSVALREYAQHAQLDTITSVFLIPTALIDLVNDCTVKIINTQGGGTYTYYAFNGKGFPYTHGYSVNGRPSAIDSYTPVNKKLLTAPYVGLLLYNMAGSSNFLGYEYFNDPTAPVIRCQGVPTVGGNIYCAPVGYKGDALNFLEGIACGKFPSLGWSADIYTNWLTQNAVNIGMGLGSALLSIGVGAGVSAAGMDGSGAITSGITEIRTTLSEMYQRSITPLTSRGMVNQGDVFTAAGNNEVYVKPVSITAQFARRIDSFFTRFGYQTNQTKIPNQLGRSNWNYVKIAAGENVGQSRSTEYFSVPAASMETINNIYRKGVTIWHNHANIGDYSVSNTIVS